ncbi:MAG: hypothetical protein ABR540_08185 [Acidimicrobiales bacterium]
MIPILDHPANALLLRWLGPIGVRVPAVLSSWELDVYTLLAHPDLTARMLDLAQTWQCMAIHGFPALVGTDGQVDVVCAGLGTLIVRGDEPPERLVRAGAQPPIGWMAFDAWSTNGPVPESDAQLREVVRAARLR